MFTTVVRIKSLLHFETYLYSRNESSMIIWRANKAGYIIPGLSSTADSSHNAAAARNEIRFSFFLLFLSPTHKTLWTSETTSHISFFFVQIYLDILLITLTQKLIQAGNLCDNKKTEIAVETLKPEKVVF